MSKLSSFFKFMRLFKNWPLAATVRYRRGKAGAEQCLEFRDGRRLHFSPVLEHGVIGEVFVFETYRACTEVARVRTVWDIGANIGSFVLWASSKFPGAEFHSFEPALPTFARLKRNQEANPAVRWTAHPFGFSNCDETVVARLPEEASGQAGRYTSSGQEIHLDLRDIEAFWIGQGRPVLDVVKIDCEGGEYCIFDRMSAEMLQSIRAIVMETHPVEGRTFTEIQNRLEAAGFRVRHQANPDGNADWYASRETMP
jgi:FkbM family methyltransferase